MPNEINVSPINELNKAPIERVSKEMIKAANQPLNPVSTLPAVPPPEDDDIKYTHFEQGSGLCGPASLRILLSHYNKNYSEEDLVKLCDATKEYGTEHDGLIKGAKALGFAVFAKENGSMEDLKYFLKEKKLPVIIDWFDKDGDHYSVVVNITDKNLIIIDPAMKQGGRRQLDLKDVPQIWFGFIGKDNRTVSWNWFMTVTPEPQQFKVLGNYY